MALSIYQLTDQMPVNSVILCWRLAWWYIHPLKEEIDLFKLIDFLNQEGCIAVTFQALSQCVFMSDKKRPWYQHLLWQQTCLFGLVLEDRACFDGMFSVRFQAYCPFGDHAGLIYRENIFKPWNTRNKKNVLCAFAPSREKRSCSRRSCAGYKSVG